MNRRLAARLTSGNREPSLVALVLFVAAVPAIADFEIWRSEKPFTLVRFAGTMLRIAPVLGVALSAWWGKSGRPVGRGTALYGAVAAICFMTAYSLLNARGVIANLSATLIATGLCCLLFTLASAFAGRQADQSGQIRPR